MKTAEETITEEWKDFDLKRESFKDLAIKAMKIYSKQNVELALKNFVDKLNEKRILKSCEKQNFQIDLTKEIESIKMEVINTLEP